MVGNGGSYGIGMGIGRLGFFVAGVGGGRRKRRVDVNSGTGRTTSPVCFACSVL